MPEFKQEKKISLSIDPQAEMLDPADERRICPSPKRPTQDYSKLLPSAELRGLTSFFSKLDVYKTGKVSMVAMLREVRRSSKARVLFGLENTSMGNINMIFNKMFSQIDTDAQRQINLNQMLGFFYQRWKKAKESLYSETKKVKPLALSTAMGHRVIADNLDATCMIEVDTPDHGGKLTATGILVKDGYLLTSSRVIPNYQAAGQATATFFHESDSKRLSVKLRPDKLFHRGKDVLMQSETLGFVCVGFDTTALITALLKDPVRSKLCKNTKMLPSEQITDMMSAVATHVNDVKSGSRLGEDTPLVLIQHNEETTKKTYHSVHLAKTTRNVIMYDVHRASELQEHTLKQTPGSPIFTLDGSISGIHMRSPVGFSLTQRNVKSRRKALPKLDAQSSEIQAMGWGLSIDVIVKELRNTIHQASLQAGRHAFASRALEARRLYRKIMELHPSRAVQSLLLATEFLYLGDAKRAHTRKHGSKKRGEPPVLQGLREWDREPFLRCIDLMEASPVTGDDVQWFPEGSLKRNVTNQFVLLGPELESKEANAKIVAEAGDEESTLRVRNESMTEKLCYTTCVEHCTEGIALDSQRAECYVIRGIAHMRLRRYEDAIRDFNVVVGLEEKANNEGSEERLADTFCFRGHCYALVEDVASAVSDFSKAIRLADQVPGYYLCRGNALIKTEEIRQKASLDDIPSRDLQDSKELTNATTDYTTALSLREGVVEALYQRGRALSAQWKLAGAIRDLNACLKLDPEHSSAYLNRAMCYQKKVRKDMMESLKLCDNEETKKYLRAVNTMMNYPPNKLTPRKPFE